MDSAILRPGRFDEQFEIGVPDIKGREEIFKVQLRGRRPSLSDSDFRVLSERTDGFTAADIASIVERAALNAAERDADHITLEDLTSHLY
jgi:cell division protease FtsH